MWQHKWKVDSELGSTLNSPVDHADCDFFPNIHTLWGHYQLQVVNVSVRSACSLRNTMGQGRLNVLAMLYYHRDVQITPEEVVDEFARRHSRRMLLI